VGGYTPHAARPGRHERILPDYPVRQLRQLRDVAQHVRLRAGRFGPARWFTSSAAHFLSTPSGSILPLAAGGAVQSLRNVLRVPLPYALIAALLVRASGLTVPEPLMKPIASAGSAAVPVLLMVLGMELSQTRVDGSSGRSQRPPWSAWSARPCLRSSRCRCSASPASLARCALSRLPCRPRSLPSSWPRNSEPSPRFVTSVVLRPRC